MDAALDLTLACALEVEERVARRAGARAARIGLGVTLPLPEGQLVSFGFAGGLVPELQRGALLTATQIVSETGEKLWEGPPLEVDGARQAVICSTDRVIDDPEERRRLAERTGAIAVDMESGKLAATGRLAGTVRAVSDSPGRPLGGLATAVRPDGSTDWKVVARSVVTEPLTTGQALLGAQRARASLQQAAKALA
jgi:adenosylhomocysteine nucleosidase